MRPLRLRTDLPEVTQPKGRLPTCQHSTPFPQPSLVTRFRPQHPPCREVPFYV